ncbi:MAG: hypothetical protein K8R21_09750 [Leptospira sp.]|nr:hypothetical protein [Leptospira sp.]
MKKEPLAFMEEKASKKNPKKSIATSWGGNELIQEEREILGAKSTVYTLGGGAWILHDKIKLSAASIEIIGEDAIQGNLKSGVRVDDVENRIVLRSGKGVYDKFKETIILRERPILTHRNKENQITKITAPNIIRYLGELKTVFEKGVIIDNKEFLVIGDSAVYLEKEDRINMENYPYIFGKNRFLTGDILYYNSESKDVVLENNAVMYYNSLEKKRKKVSDKNEEVKKTAGVNENDTAISGQKDSKPDSGPEEEKIKKTSVFLGDKILYHSTGEKYIGVYGNANLKRDDAEFTAAYIKGFGKDFQNVEAKESVVMKDFENNVILYGNLLEYDKEQNYTHLTEDPKVEFLNEKSKEVSSTLKAVEIERFMDKKEIVARGNVSIETEDSVARGEFATYVEEEERIYLEGNPTLDKDGKILKCGKIIIYPRENKVILTDGLNIDSSREKRKNAE